MPDTYTHCRVHSDAQIMTWKITGQERHLICSFSSIPRYGHILNHYKPTYPPRETRFCICCEYYLGDRYGA